MDATIVKKTIPEVSEETKILVSVLREAKTGETVSYKKLSAAINRDVQREAYGLLSSARKIVQREDRTVFVPVLNEGLRNATDQIILDIESGGVRRIRRCARRVIRAGACLKDYVALSADEKVKHNVALTQLALASRATQGRTEKKLCAASGIEKHKLALEASIEAMRLGGAKIAK
jgi:hypothetical protein